MVSNSASFDVAMFWKETVLQNRLDLLVGLDVHGQTTCEYAGDPLSTLWSTEIVKSHETTRRFSIRR